ncbi:hypothetical protein FJZ53_03165 [Candidatus Woesearchaeota archaeon]|nr:hypothetical protein [Candidatus Woesearchaeota archaeon]
MIALVFALLLTILHVFSRRISKIIEKHHINITSFSAGMFITLILIDLLPRMIDGLEYKAPVFLIMTIGFVGFHISEKYLYQHVRNKHLLLEELAELHNFGFFMNHLMIGFVLVLTFELRSVTSYLVIIPFVLHTISSSMSLEHIHEKMKTKFNKFVLNTSTFLGALFAYFAGLENFWYYTIFALSLGALMYISIRDMLPGGKKGNTLMFFFGFLLTLGIVAII